MNGIEYRLAGGVDYTDFWINGRLFRVSETRERQWDVYSKAWHRAHGPKITTFDRRLCEATKSGWIKVADIPAYRGKWLRKALYLAGVPEHDITMQIAADRMGITHPPMSGR